LTAGLEVLGRPAVSEKAILASGRGKLFRVDLKSGDYAMTNSPLTPLDEKMGLLGNLVSGARLLSVAHYSLGIANAIAHDANLDAGVSAGTAITMGAIVTAAALAVAARGLASFSLKGDAI